MLPFDLEKCKASGQSAILMFVQHYILLSRKFKHPDGKNLNGWFFEFFS